MRDDSNMARERDLWDFVQTPPRLLGPDEIFERADEELLRSLNENRSIERKPASYGGAPLGEYICMWANTLPDGGVMAIGVQNNGDIEGCMKLSGDQVNEREKTGHVFCPDAKCQSRQVKVRNRDGQQDFVILFRVWYNPNVVVRDSKGEVFVRKGDSKCRLSPEEIRELQVDKGETSFEQQPCPLSFPDDFESGAISQFVDKVRKARNLSEQLTVPEVLNVRHLGTIRKGAFVPNYACGLLFGKDPLRLIPGCKIRFQRFEGEQERTGQRYNAVKDVVLEGNVPSLIQQVEAMLESQLRVFSPLDESGKFFPVPEYPKPAWYEAIVNACVHRSYGNGMKNMPIFVKMFDDRLVVESPGPFPPFVTPENIYDVHQPRNPKLMDALFYLDLVKCAHEGARRIRDTMAEMKLPEPEFRQVEEGHFIVRVTLRNNIKQRRAWIDKDVSRLVTEAIAADLTEEEKRVLNWAAEHDSITISDANKLLVISWQSARKLLLGLAARRIFQYVRFKKYEKDKRDPQAFFRLRSNKPLPEGAFEQVITLEVMAGQED
jgi:ATP-dependent DNA helicase RecG